MPFYEPAAPAEHLPRLPALEFALTGSTADYLNQASPDLLSQARAFEQWESTRLAQGLLPFARSLQAPPAAHTTLREQDGRDLAGLNFSSQEYLALSSHPAVVAAAQEAMTRFGVHSTGSCVLAGNVGEGVALEHA